MQMRFFGKQADEQDEFDMSEVAHQGQSKAAFAAKGSLEIPDKTVIQSCQDPTGSSFLRTITHHKVDADLFRHPPCMQDINQGGVTGDCFLLSSLLAILALPQGSACIQNMIKDEGQSVVVRLFDDYHKPHFIRVEKSIPEQFGVLNNGALWVKLIEKAYAAYRGGKYSLLDKGYAYDVIAVLTGAVNHHFLDEYCSFPFQNKKPLSSLRDYVDGNGIYLMNELLRYSSRTPAAIKKRILQQVFQNDQDLFLQWSRWIEGKQKDWQMLITRCHPIRKHEMNEFFLSCEIGTHANEAVRRVQSWIEQEKIVSGPLLSGEYSKEELDLFASIQKRLQKNCPMTVSTGENFREGLLPLHNYAVTGCEENTVTKRKYIHVVNPYGASRSWLSRVFASGGRTSVDVLASNKSTQWNVKIQSTSQPVSRMELSDFCRSFDYLDAFSEVSVQAMNDRVAAACKQDFEMSSSITPTW